MTEDSPWKGLNARQKKCVELYQKGMTQQEAYEAAGYTTTGRVSETAASRLFSKVKTKRYLEYLQKKASDETVLSLLEKRRFLADVVRTPIGDLDSSSKLIQEIDESKIKLMSKAEAIKIDNQMAGHNEPEKMDHKHDLSDELSLIMKSVASGE